MILASLHGGDAVLLEGCGVEEVHGTRSACSPDRVVRPEDEVRCVRELRHVALVLYVDDPDLVVGAELRLHGHAQEGLQEEVRRRAPRVAPLLRGHDLAKAAPAESDYRQVGLEVRGAETVAHTDDRGWPHFGEVVPLGPWCLAGRRGQLAALREEVGPAVLNADLAGVLLRVVVSRHARGHPPLGEARARPVGALPGVEHREVLPLRLAPPAHAVKNIDVIALPELRLRSRSSHGRSFLDQSEIRPSRGHTKAHLPAPQP
mmetsp:Transcript_46880/g.133731  ORF Transcript_46880/g.133731 Transcript_46880/m.133731 type:complete len:261 (-) Transcript_46880:2-784(-)